MQHDITLSNVLAYCASPSYVACTD